MQRQGSHGGLLPQKANGKEPSCLMQLLVVTHAPCGSLFSASVYTGFLPVVSAWVSQDMLEGYKLLSKAQEDFYLQNVPPQYS